MYCNPSLLFHEICSPSSGHLDIWSARSSPRPPHSIETAEKPQFPRSAPTPGRMLRRSNPLNLARETPLLCAPALLALAVLHVASLKKPKRLWSIYMNPLNKPYNSCDKMCMHIHTRAHSHTNARTRTATPVSHTHKVLVLCARSHRSGSVALPCAHAPNQTRNQNPPPRLRLRPIAHGSDTVFGSGCCSRRRRRCPENTP